MDKFKHFLVQFFTCCVLLQYKGSLKMLSIDTVKIIVSYILEGFEKILFDYITIHLFPQCAPAKPSLSTKCTLFESEKSNDLSSVTNRSTYTFEPALDTSLFGFYMSSG